MKKIIVFVLLLFLVSCSDSVSIPEDAKVATCNQGDLFKYVYKDDTVYEFYSNNELQDDSMLNIVQKAADGYENFEGYLDATFTGDVCSIENYTSE